MIPEIAKAAVHKIAPPSLLPGAKSSIDIVGCWTTDTTEWGHGFEFIYIVNEQDYTKARNLNNQLWVAFLRGLEENMTFLVSALQP